MPYSDFSSAGREEGGAALCCWRLSDLLFPLEEDEDVCGSGVGVGAGCVSPAGEPESELWTCFDFSSRTATFLQQATKTQEV